MKVGNMRDKIANLVMNTLMYFFYTILNFIKGFLFGIMIVLGLCSIAGLIIWWLPVSII